jgi:hypothetical protein
MLKGSEAAERAFVAEATQLLTAASLTMPICLRGVVLVSS